MAHHHVTVSVADPSAPYRDRVLSYLRWALETKPPPGASATDNLLWLAVARQVEQHLGLAAGADEGNADDDWEDDAAALFPLVGRPSRSAQHPTVRSLLLDRMAARGSE